MGSHLGGWVHTEFTEFLLMCPNKHVFFVCVCVWSSSRIMEMQVEEENELRWEELAGGWSSVRSPQWLRSKWWNIKRQVSNHKEIPFSRKTAGSQSH